VRIAAITSTGICGIADYADQLIQGLKRTKCDADVLVDANWLDPQVFLNDVKAVLKTPEQPELVWLNHHAGLHARWSPAYIKDLQELKIPVVATLHDTRADQNMEALLGLYGVCNATIVHETCADMPKAHYIRHGVPMPTEQDGYRINGWIGHPYLGSIGFNFPWKNFDRLADLTGSIGWGFKVISNNATDEDEARWRRANPRLMCFRKFMPQHEVVAELATCDATAFMYECANNGVSGALRQGLAAGKPVYALSGCRQFRDLYEDPLAGHIHWVENWEELAMRLPFTTMGRLHLGICSLAFRDNWDHQAQKYFKVFQSVLQ
jgi:hypothetical protein